MNKYGLLIYDESPSGGNQFDVVAIDVEYLYPTSKIGTVTDGNSQTQKIFVRIPFKIVSDNNWVAAHTNAINQAVTNWDSANSSNKVPTAMKLIFTNEEKDEIWEQLADQEAAL